MSDFQIQPDHLVTVFILAAMLWEVLVGRTRNGRKSKEDWNMALLCSAAMIAIQRPALVLAISSSDHAVTVAYGTSQKTAKLYPGEFVLKDYERAFVDSGLTQTTNSDLSHAANLYFNSDWFAPSPGFVSNSPLPKMGVLHPSYLAAAKKALSEL